MERHRTTKQVKTDTNQLKEAEPQKKTGQEQRKSTKAEAARQETAKTLQHNPNIVCRPSTYLWPHCVALISGIVRRSRVSQWKH